MLPGSNTNIRHGGVLFHVQTEDSGRAHPHVITHLYYGGTILASEKSSYADAVDAPNLPARVRELMDAQHHAMLKRLASGELDEQIEQRLGPTVFTAGDKSKTGARTTRGASDSGSVTGTSDARELSEPERTQRPAPGRTSAPRPPAAPSAPRPSAPDRPLDELILDYLVEAARRRKRRAE